MILVVWFKLRWRNLINLEGFFWIKVKHHPIAFKRHIDTRTSSIIMVVCWKRSFFRIVFFQVTLSIHTMKMEIFIKNLPTMEKTNLWLIQIIYILKSQLCDYLFFLEKTSAVELNMCFYSMGTLKMSMHKIYLHLIFNI